MLFTKGEYIYGVGSLYIDGLQSYQLATANTASSPLLLHLLVDCVCPLQVLYDVQELGNRRHASVLEGGALTQVRVIVIGDKKEHWRWGRAVSRVRTTH